MDSAGGTVVKARNREFHAILKLRGKPKQTTKIDYKAMLQNEEMKDFVSSIGMGIDQMYSLENPRYGMIIIAADADADGAFIAASILATCGTHMKFLLEAGMVYVALSPLYYQEGRYIYPGEEHLLNRKKGFSRFKGLGEMNPSQLRDTLLDKTKRRLIRVTTDNVEEAIRLMSFSNAKKSLMWDLGILRKEDLTSEELLAAVTNL